MKWSARTKRWIGVSALGVLALVALLVGGYYTWLMTPPPMPTTADEALKLLSSPRYTRLPQSRRMDYMQRAAELYDRSPYEKQKELVKLARKDRDARRAYEQAFQDRFYMEVSNYVKADDFERRMIVDRVIAMQMMMEGKLKNRLAKSTSTPEGRARQASREKRFVQQVQKQIEQGNPQHQAYAGEFFGDIMDRREAMGLPRIPEMPR